MIVKCLEAKSVPLLQVRAYTVKKSVHTTLNDVVNDIVWDANHTIISHPTVPFIAPFDVACTLCYLQCTVCVCVCLCYPVCIQRLMLEHKLIEINYAVFVCMYVCVYHMLQEIDTYYRKMNLWI